MISILVAAILAASPAARGHAPTRRGPACTRARGGQAADGRGVLRKSPEMAKRIAGYRDSWRETFFTCGRIH
ncbi:MAG: hypothetical protein NTU95_12175 [Methanothrix sp.]|nr:hypothetical protein [Methanothrix sp.]